MKDVTLNSTAFRVFKILTWLIDHPHSVDELNQRFVTEKQVQRAVSEDSIWLYINTLKAVGCEISRPTETNGYRYALTYHPFGSALNTKDLETLIKIKPIAQTHLNYPDIMAFDRFFKTLLENSYEEDRKNLGKALFSSTRSVDYEPQQRLVDELVSAIHTQTLLFVTYKSLVKGQDHFYFLPEAIRYDNGVMYINGSRLGYEQLFMLRVDKIVQLENADEPAIRAELTQMQSERLEVVVHFPEISPSQWIPFHMGETLMTDTNGGIEVHFKTRDTFMLKQKLFETGYPFRVLAPQSLKAELLESLLATKKIYQTHRVTT